jgi:hypothetical protein
MDPLTADTTHLCDFTRRIGTCWVSMNSKDFIQNALNRTNPTPRMRICEPVLRARVSFFAGSITVTCIPLAATFLREGTRRWPAEP